MKTSSIIFAATAALSGLASAQNRADYLPECSLKCLDDATKKATDCSLDDAVCWCVQKNYEDIYDAGVACVLQACGPDRAVTEVLPAAAAFCSAASASASAATASSTSAAASSTSTVTSVVTSTEAASASVTTAPTTTSGERATSTPVETTTSDAGAAATGYIGGAAMLAMGALALF